MSNTLQLKALLKKNIILMKRNLCSTLCEILFPIILMLLLVSVRNLIKVEEEIFDYTDLSYLRNESAAFTTDTNITNTKFTFWNNMTYRNPYITCSKRKKKTNLIAIVSSEEKFEILKEKMNRFSDEEFKPTFRNFKSKDELFNYIKDIKYGQLVDYPEICFGFTYLKTANSNYNISLHFSDTNVVSKIKEIPTTMLPALDPFKTGPDMTSYDEWIHSGALQIHQLLNEQILQDETNNQNAELSLGVIPEKYYSVYDDKFGEFIGAILSFFLVIAYLCPLCILVFRIVQEKESRAKEGMKIMGLSSLTYFLSFFLYWLILNTIYSLINAYILTYVLKYVSYIWIFVFLWLYGMTIFAFAYLLQATMNKTRVAMIMTVLLYFVMYFISAAVLQQEIPSTAKLFLSLMPTTCLGFGLFTLTKFDSNQVNFGYDQLTIPYLNFSVANMYIMLIIDIFLYIFVGYYLENVLPQEFGLTKKWNFLCTKNFWCKKKSKIKSNIGNLSISKMNLSQNSKEDKEKNNNDLSIDNNFNENLLNQKEQNNNEESKDYINTPHVIDRLSRASMKKGKLNSKENFQSEENYKDRVESGSCLQIKNLKKIFDDGKKAVDGLSINFYQNEIFALLGHNGAGKSTTISILTGLYEASAGEALYEGENILEESSMEELRKIMGICPQNDILFTSLTVKEHLEMFSIFKGIPSENVSEEVDKILNDLMFVNKKDTIANFLSGGEKRKLSIALALIGGSKIVFLDEPSSGMDITSRRNLWEILKKLTNDRIIVLTTHYMEEAAVLGNRIGIMSNGQLKCCGNSLFLIDKFGKYVSLNIFKNRKANDSQIVEFVKKTLKEKINSFANNDLLESIEVEILSEEILVRIPKTNDFSFKTFFEEFDKNLEELNIKTYEAAMPSLEDVFLNVTAETSILGNSEEKKKKQKEETKDLNEEDIIKEKLKIKGSFSDQFIAITNKRLINLYRDKKSFLLEIIVPFVLVLIGLLISSVTFFEDSPSLINSLDALPLPENIIIGKNLLFDNTKIDEFFLNSENPEKENITSYDNKADPSNLQGNLIDFNNYLFDLYNKTDPITLKKKNAFGNYLFLKTDNQSKSFIFTTYLNTNSRYSAIIFPQNMFNKIINFAKGENVIINSFTEPIPLTSEEKNAGQARNISNLVFFVSVAFALIPANFITIIIRERELNNKHLQLLSGVSKFRYWISNFIFELLKYYVIGGLISIVIYLFDDFVEYFWMFYVFYGPSMILFTYFLSFVFENESSGQNGVILLNFLLGTLAGNVILVFRVLPDTTELGKTLANIFRIVPSFALTYGYSQLLLKDLLITIDKNIGKDVSMLDLDYAGMDLLFLGICFVVSLILLIIIETNVFRGGLFKSKNKENVISEIGIDSNRGKGFNDKSINYDNEEDDNLKMITTPAKKNLEENDDLEKDEIEQKYSIQVKDLVKTYSAGGFLGMCAKDYPAVKKLSFDLKFGECFALLGVTGAGKTSTFKCLTNETNINDGFVEINGIRIDNNLGEISNLIGYCPQKDAIFDYMTVYENLNFYAAIKGINENRDDIIMDLINEMNLQSYRNKISGKLSGGNKRKLSVAISLIGNPPIILLDEPSTGMDPEARRFMWAVIYKISTRNKLSSVVLTTHSMEEAETLCRRIGIMVDGEFKCLGTNQFIKDKYGDSFEISYTINNSRNDSISNYFKNAFPNKTIGQIEEFIVFESAIEGLKNLEKKEIYTKLFSNFVFNEVEGVENIEKTTITIKSFCKYVYYIDNILELISELLIQFNSISIIYIYENNIKLKLPKTGNHSTPTIGFLLGMLEENKRKFNVSEFSITQTSLEQIFNKFASEKETVVRSDIKEISIKKEDL